MYCRYQRAISNIVSMHYMAPLINVLIHDQGRINAQAYLGLSPGPLAEGGPR